MFRAETQTLNCDSNEFNDLQNQTAKRQEDNKHELRSLLTQYLVREGVRLQVTKAQKEKEALGSAVTRFQ